MKKSIEKDIKRCNKLIEVVNVGWIGLSNQLAIKHLLSDYKRVLKENNEWKRAYQEEKDRQFDLIRKSQKKDEIIDLMAEKIVKEGIVWENKEEVKKYFENKIEESEE